MRHKKSWFFGFALFGLVVLMAVSTYYASHGDCPSDYLQCDGSKCIAQKFVCDFNTDCKDGSDEDENMCNNNHGSIKAVKLNADDAVARLRNTMEKYNFSEYNTEVFKMFCAYNESEIPEDCKCRQATFIGCTAYHPPTSFPENVAILYLSKIQMVFNEGDSFEKYQNLSLLNLSWNNISFIPSTVFRNLKRLRVLFLNNNQIEELPRQIFLDADALVFLALECNRLVDFDLSVFEPLRTLRLLDLSHNSLTLKDAQFPVMPNLFQLTLDFNQIKTIDGLFENLENLTKLSLRHNCIEFIGETSLAHLNQLVELQLSDNPLTALDGNCFRQTPQLKALYLDALWINIDEQLLGSLNVSFISLKDIPEENITFKAIAGLGDLQYAVFEKFSYCSKIPSSTLKVCRPKTDGVSSSNDLLRNPKLRIAAIVMATVTFLTNLLVLWERFSRKKSCDENQLVSLVIKNLAVSDLIMSFYLAIIIWHDIQYRETYQQIAFQWIKSWWCVVAGALSMISSEVTILILTFMSFERFLLISNPFGLFRLTHKHVIMSLYVIWIIGISIAVFPVILFSSSTMYYGVHNGGTCFPLFIQETHQLGWQYSAVVFFFVNPTLLVIITSLYMALLISVWRTRRATTLQLREYEFAIRFFFIFLTDVLCWAPIIVSKILAVAEIGVSGDFYAYLVIFALPLNSAVNPLLFTFTTPKYRDQILMTFSKRSFSRSHDSNQVTAEQDAKAAPHLSHSFSSSTSSKLPSLRKKS